MSPGGDLVAFVDHPALDSNWGFLSVVDRAGKVRVLTREWARVGSLLWSPTGKEVFFSRWGSNEIRGARLWTGALAARRGFPDSTTSRRDGLFLDTGMYRENYRSVIRALVPGESEERNLSWLAGSTVADLSNDGKKLLLYEEGSNANRPDEEVFTTYLRSTDGSDAVKLGEGRALALSPDGEWALVMRPSPEPHLVLLPTGRRRAAAPSGRPGTSVSTGGRPSSPTGGGSFSNGRDEGRPACVPTFRTSREAPRSPSAGRTLGAVRFARRPARSSPKGRRAWVSTRRTARDRLARSKSPGRRTSLHSVERRRQDDLRARGRQTAADPVSTGSRDRTPRALEGARPSRPNGLSVLRAGRGGAGHEHHSRRPVLRLYLPDRLEPARPRRGRPGLVEVRRSRSAGRRDRLALDAPTPIEIDCRSSRSPRPQPGARGLSG